MAKSVKARCSWVNDDPLYIDYHDNEWGRPVHDDSVLFELLILESAQAGLSWYTILKRREGYRKAFSNFDFAKVAKYTVKKIDTLAKDESIIRHRGKIEAAVSAAKIVLAIQKECGSFDKYIWQFTDPNALSKDLKQRGVKFFGPTIAEAFMGAVGIFDHHEAGCYLFVK